MCPKMTSKQLKANWSDGCKYTDSQILKNCMQIFAIIHRIKVTF